MIRTGVVNCNAVVGLIVVTTVVLSVVTGKVVAILEVAAIIVVALGVVTGVVVVVT